MKLLPNEMDLFFDNQRSKIKRVINIAQNIEAFDDYLNKLSNNNYENAVQFVLKIFNEVRNEINDTKCVRRFARV